VGKCPKKLSKHFDANTLAPRPPVIRTYFSKGPWNFLIGNLIDIDGLESEWIWRKLMDPNLVKQLIEALKDIAAGLNIIAGAICFSAVLRAWFNK
jgi:hypothetical protein